MTALPVLSLLAFAARTGGPGSTTPTSAPWSPPISAPRSSSLSASVSLSTSGTPERDSLQLFCGQRELFFQILTVPNWKQFLKIRITIRGSILNQLPVKPVHTNNNGTSSIPVPRCPLTNTTWCNNKYYNSTIYRVKANFQTAQDWGCSAAMEHWLSCTGS